MSGRPQREYESVMPLLSLSPLNVNPLKLYPITKASSESGFVHTFIYSRAVNNNVISNGKAYCCNDTFTDVQFTSLLAKNIQEEYKLFVC